jgi:S-DNA-T family DNA segregation ATPase FtsK/SpoIIIE
MTNPNHSKLIEAVTASHKCPVRVLEQIEAPQAYIYRCEPGDLLYSNGNRNRTVRVREVVRRAEDIALGLGAQRVRVRADGDIFIEVPKARTSIVTPEMVACPVERGHLHVPLGITTHADALTLDFANQDSPHLLIAGTTGSGKSVCVKSILAYLIENYSPDALHLALIDLKQVELTGFQTAHVKRVATGVGKAVSDLNDIASLLTQRAQVLQEMGLTDASQARGMPRIVAIIDEYADLTIRAQDAGLGGDLKYAMTRIAQLGRAMGIHLILATQRPEYRVVDTMIRANFPARVCFRVDSKLNSKIVLDRPGAEDLNGSGDGLFMQAGLFVRFQGIYRSDADLKRVIAEAPPRILPPPKPPEPEETEEQRLARYRALIEEERERLGRNRKRDKGWFERLFTSE